MQIGEKWTEYVHGHLAGLGKPRFVHSQPMRPLNGCTDHDPTLIALRLEFVQNVLRLSGAQIDLAQDLSDERETLNRHTEHLFDGRFSHERLGQSVLEHRLHPFHDCR